MPFGPIMDRELLTLPRRPRMFSARAGLALMMGVALGANYYGWREFHENGGHFTPSQLASFAQSTFLSLAAFQLLMTLASVPALVAPAVAEEKERKTLHYLLASRLGSGEIVLGKLAARMLQYLAAVAAGVPILLMLTLLGGFRPEWVLALFVLTVSMAAFLGGLSMLSSVLARRTKGATNMASLWAAGWFGAPVALWIVGLLGIVPAWSRPALDLLNEWFLASSPTSMFASFAALTGRVGMATLVEQYWRMVALQWGYAALFVLLAVWRLRPAFRRLDDPEPVPWRTLLGYREAWAFAAGKFFTDPIWWFYLFWIPGFLHDQYKLDLQRFGPPLVVIYVMADVGSIGGGWLSGAMIRRGSSPPSARRRTMLLCALLVLPVLAVSQTANQWVATLLIGLAAAAHQGWSANLFTSVSDAFPRKAVARVVGLGGMAGAVGGMLIAKFVGFVLDATDRNYFYPFLIAGVAYLVAFAVMQLILAGQPKRSNA